jgi:peptidoglycan/LPS O-acetylase OafA/YrhL
MGIGRSDVATASVTGGEKHLSIGRFSFPTVASEFSGRSNCIGFFRWFFAFVVIFDHLGPLAGYFDGEHFMGVEPSTEQSIGGIAVAGFFFFSGFLITKSRRSLPVGRFFWHRLLRIFPAIWLALVLVAFVIAPIGWVKDKGSISGYWSADVDSPFTYVFQNMFLMLDQRNIAGMGESLPYFEASGGGDQNGSAWTLQYEFKAYLMVGLVGLIGWALGRYVLSAIAVSIITLNALLWTGHIQPATWFGGDLAYVFGHEFLADPFNFMLLSPYAFGILLACWSDKVPITWWLALAGLVLGVASFTQGYWGSVDLGVVTIDQGYWNAFGQFGIMYVFMWSAVRLRWLFPWERKFGDLSYGTYILAWPLMQLACYYGLNDQPVLLYLAVIISTVTLYALFSWHVIEKPALSLKDWTPALPKRSEAAAASAPPPVLEPAPATDPSPSPVLATTASES